MARIFLSVDVDWAPEAAIQDCLELLSGYGFPFTVFSTHDSAAVRQWHDKGGDVGLHPNFNPLLDGTQSGKTFRDVVGQLKDLYPHSQGIRPHSLVGGSRFTALYKEMGFAYSSSILSGPKAAIQPFREWNGVPHLPIHWEDDIHGLGDQKTPLPTLDLSSFAVFVMNVHPIHVFLNTMDEAHYERAKPHYQDAEKLGPFRNRDKAGVRTQLVSFLDLLKKPGCAHRVVPAAQIASAL